MAEATEVTRTRRVEVVDDEGRVRAVLGVLGVGDDLRYGLGLYNEAGRERAWVATEGRSAEVGLDYGGNTVVSLVVADDGHPSLNLHD